MKHAMAKRSITKSLTWRFCATLTTIALVWLFTGETAMALSIGLVEVIVKMAIYYFHERIWNKIDWGLYNIDS